MDVVALADPEATRLALIGDEFGFTGRYASAQAMLAAEALDVVSVCTPKSISGPPPDAAWVLNQPPKPGMPRRRCHTLRPK